MPVKKLSGSGKAVRCPMPGLVVSIAVAEGQEVKAGETLAVVEAMKMENILRAERDGTIKNHPRQERRQRRRRRGDHGICLSAGGVESGMMASLPGPDYDAGTGFSVLAGRAAEAAALHLWRRCRLSRLALASHLLTTAACHDARRAVAVHRRSILLIWVWFCLHAKRLHDAGHGSGLAVGIALLYALSVVLLLIVADGFFNTSDGLMSNANATSALGLILILYIFSTLAGSSQYDLAWAVVAILTLIALLPIVGGGGIYALAATRPSAEGALRTKS